jgi:hypothetical protein
MVEALSVVEVPSPREARTAPEAGCAWLGTDGAGGTGGGGTGGSGEAARGPAGAAPELASGPP